MTTPLPTADATTAISEQSILSGIRQHPLLATPVEQFNDDCYVSDTGLVITTDVLVGGKHFRREWSTPFEIGWKAAAVSLSDLASCSAQPIGLTVGLTLPKTVDNDFINGVYDGLLTCLNTHGGQLLGGDTVASRTLAITTTAVGQIPNNQTAGRRFLAKPGDKLWLLGNHGLSDVGYRCLKSALTDSQQTPFKEALTAHRKPVPYVDAGLKLGQLINEQLGNKHTYALTDTSDGLADGLLNLAECSQVNCIVDSQHIAIHPVVNHWATTYPQQAPSRLPQPLHTTLYGGEDFGLLAALPASIQLPQPWCPIGEVTPLEASHPPQAAIHYNGQLLPLSRTFTYQHF
jgi:thiamine-monophosphate kinase